jgi:hypothetical protein
LQTIGVTGDGEKSLNCNGVKSIVKIVNKQLRFITLIFLFVMIICGCSSEDRRFEGIKKNNIQEISNSSSTEFVHEYRGYSLHWAANYIVYKMKGTNNHRTVMLLKFIGKNMQPTGSLSYSYISESGGGNGTVISGESKNGIFNLGFSGGNGSVENKDSIVKMRIDWNETSESFELKPMN